MAPNMETNNVTVSKPRRRLSMENLQRTFSDVSLDLSREAIDATQQLPPISEVEDADCECCGMSEDCTPEYINQVKGKFSGKLVCGLCAEAIKEETDKNGGEREEALKDHMSACVRFKQFGRTHPVLYQAEAMREMVKKSSSGIRAKSMSTKMGGIARSSSCMSAISKDIGDRAMMN